MRIVQQSVLIVIFQQFIFWYNYFYFLLVKMYHVRNSCKINIIWNRSMHDRDASIFHEFSQDFLLNISNYYYGNTVNRCYCTTIKHINKVLSSVISFAKKKQKLSSTNQMWLPVLFYSKLHPKLILKDHRNNPRSYKNHITERLFSMTISTFN